MPKRVSISPFGYNWGYPAPLKNAIDHLYNEWRVKPAAIVSSGGHGGGKCAEQLRQGAGALKKMRMMPTAPALVLSDDVIRHGAPVDPERNFKGHAESIAQAFSELAAEMEAAAASAAKPWEQRVCVQFGFMGGA